MMPSINFDYIKRGRYFWNYPCFYILPQCKDLHQSADPPDRCWCFRTLHFVLSAPIRPITLLDTIISDNSVNY